MHFVRASGGILFSLFIFTHLKYFFKFCKLFLTSIRAQDFKNRVISKDEVNKIVSFSEMYVVFVVI
jgi:hypothetical protein